MQWVYNILDHGKEKERILIKDDCPELGFVAIPDLKWDGKDVSSLYYLAIVRQKNLKSIRDLNETHLPMLKNVRDKVTVNILYIFNVCFITDNLESLFYLGTGYLGFLFDIEIQ